MIELNKTKVIAASIIVIAQIVLYALKLSNVITIGWFWVFTPLWASYAIVLAAGVGLIIYLIFERIFNKHERGLSDHKEP